MIEFIITNNLLTPHPVALALNCNDRFANFFLIIRDLNYVHCFFTFLVFFCMFFYSVLCHVLCIQWTLFNDDFFFVFHQSYS